MGLPYWPDEGLASVPADGAASPSLDVPKEKLVHWASPKAWLRDPCQCRERHRAPTRPEDPTLSSWT